MCARNTREICLARIELKSQHIFDAHDDMVQSLTVAYGWIGGVVDPAAKAALWGLYWAGRHAADCWLFLQDWKLTEDPKDLHTFFFEHYTIAEAEGAEEYELTWEKIVNVWLISNDEGKKWTVGMMDYMRKYIWDKPFDFPLITGRQGGGV